MISINVVLTLFYYDLRAIRGGLGATKHFAQRPRRVDRMETTSPSSEKGQHVFRATPLNPTLRVENLAPDQPRKHLVSTSKTTCRPATDFTAFSSTGLSALAPRSTISVQIVVISSTCLSGWHVFSKSGEPARRSAQVGFCLTSAARDSATVVLRMTKSSPSHRWAAGGPLQRLLAVYAALVTRNTPCRPAFAGGQQFGATAALSSSNDLLKDRMRSSCGHE